MTHRASYTMGPEAIQDILSLVEKPSRYLGTEVNRVIKKSGSVRLRVALAFPDLYEIGMSHFGMQILYSLLNQDPRVAAERVFAPAGDMAGKIKEKGLPLMTLESGRPVAGFDIVGFSLMYELNFTNILEMLDLSGIALRARDRTDAHPLVIAGGPCTCNPEPVADFFDAMVLGDGEAVMPAMVDAWLEWKEAGGRQKESLLRRWSQIEGVYVPGFFTPVWDASGFQRVVPVDPGQPLVRRAVVPDLDLAPFPEKPIVAFGRPVHDRLRIEVARGCTRGCRFCQAGMIYRPVRERSMENLLGLSDRCLEATGYEDVSLLSLSTGDYTQIEPLLRQLMGRYEARQSAVSFPSLRAGTLTPELVDLVKKVRKTGFTIAVEAGSQRLRDVINKTITDADILGTVETVFKNGWNLIKLYFMVGLPTERREDIEAIVELVQRLRELNRVKGSARRQINVSVATFIPKPHTPFQWCGQDTLAASREKIEWLHRALKLPGVNFKWQNPEVSRLEGLMARGDRRMSELIETAWRMGCRFDGWTDHFKPHRWEAAMEAVGIDADFFTVRSRNLEEPLPWDHMDTRVEKEFLKKEFQLALDGTTTPECRSGNCQGCGVCDFEHLSPHTAEKTETKTPEPAAHVPEDNQFVEMVYQKMGPARHFGHLEMVTIFVRAVRRAGIPVAYSVGFHPLPKMAFDDPLPVGMESRSERVLMTVTASVDPQGLMAALNRELPEGLSVLVCRKIAQKKHRPEPILVTYAITSAEPVFTDAQIGAYEASESVTISRVNKKGVLRQLNLKDHVRELRAETPRLLSLSIASGGASQIRPGDVLTGVFGVNEERIGAFGIVKTEVQYGVRRHPSSKRND